MHKSLPALPVQSFIVHGLGTLENFRFTFNWRNKTRGFFLAGMLNCYAILQKKQK
jgi:hypothetical protein